MFKNSFFSIVFLLFAASTLFSQQKIQLLFDETCIDRYEHYFSKVSEKPMETYAWRANSNSTVFFECDFTKTETHNSLPKGVKKCGELPLTSDMVKDFQKGERDLFLVWPNAKGGFSSAPVATAALALRNGSKTTYMEKGLTFTVDDAAFFDEKNLADPDDDYFVYQTNRSVLECEPIFRLRKESKQTCQPFSVFEFSPRYGVVRENTGMNQSEADQNGLELFKINGGAYIDALKKGCGQSVVASAQPAPITHSTQPERVVFQEPTAKPTDWKQVDEFRDRATTAGGGTRFDNWSEVVAQPVAAAEKGCQMPDKNGYFLVQKGDFLNKISRETGVAVADLRKWNGLQKTDKIYPCTYLKIAAPQKTSATKPQKAIATEPKIYTYEAPKAAAEPVVYYAQPVAQPVTFAMQPADPTMKKAVKRPLFAAPGCAGNAHEVRDGEYLYSIAKIYGTTAGELARVNGIDRFETLFPGDRLCVGSLVPVSQPETASAPVIYSSQPQVIQTSSPSPCDGAERYAVREGDALWSLAKRFGYTTDRLAKMNGLTPDARLFVGQCLSIEGCICPARSADPTEKAEAGVQYFNDAGQSYRAVETSAPIVYSTTTNGAGGGYREPASASQPFELYYWKDGDSETQVARRFDMDVAYFRQVNSLSPGEIVVVGQPVKVKAK